MDTKRRKVTDRFRARSGDGQEYELLVYTEVLDASSMQTPGAEIDGLKSIETSKGQAVNRIDDSHYEIFGDGTRLIRIEELGKP